MMDNHYHLLLETPSANLPQIMRHINGAYTIYFNKRRKRSGHLFQGGYRAILVEVDEYAKELSRYIHLNPLRAGMVDKPEAYQWSSYRYYIGKGRTPEWLHRALVLGYFGEKQSIAQKRYQRFVNALVGHDKKPDKDLPALKELTPKASIDDIFNAVDDSVGNDTKLARNVKMYLCQKYAAKKLIDLGGHFGIGESGVCQAIRRDSQRMGKDINLRRAIYPAHVV
jgi:putative transposase